MKKYISTAILTSLLILSLLTSCSSTKTTQAVSSDSYNATENSDDTSDNTSTTDKKSNTKTKKKFSEKKSYEKNEFEKFFTFGNKDDYIIIDQTSVFTPGLLGGIKQQVCDVYISVKDENYAGFGANIISNYYIFMLNQENRNKLRIAYESYLKDFENKKLERKNGKSFKQYGNINVNTNWGPLKSTTPSFGKGKVNMGYEFEKNSPYFCLTMYPIHNDYYEIAGDATTTDSMTVKFYFTKAQMKDLFDALTEENIANIYNEYYNANIILPATSDEYTD